MEVGDPGMNDETVPIPDFVVRQVGALQLQLAAANEQIQQLLQELAAVRADVKSETQNSAVS